MCHSNITAKHLYNHCLVKHEKQVANLNTKEEVQQIIDEQRAFEFVVGENTLLGCLACKKGFSNQHKFATHLLQDGGDQCKIKHREQLTYWKTLARKAGKYSKTELAEYQKQNIRYKPTDDADKNRCSYLFLAEQLQGLDMYLTNSIKRIGFINKEFDMAVKILESINTQLDVTDVQEIYTKDWARLNNRAWNWIISIQDTYFHPQYHWEFMRYTPFPITSLDPDQVELGLYLNGDVDTYKWKPIDLQCVKEYERLKNPPDAVEEFKKLYEEDMRRMKDQEERIKQDKLELAKRYKALEERAMMYEGDEEEEQEIMA